MKFKQFAVTACLFTSAMFAQSLQANVITSEVLSDSASFAFTSTTVQHSSTDSLSANSVTDIEILNLQRFDDSLGKLTDVEIWFETSWSLSSAIYANDMQSYKRTASGAGKSTVFHKVRLIDPWRETSKNKEVVIANCRDQGDCTGYEKKSGNYNGEFDLLSFTMDDFVGNDPLQFKVERKLISSVSRCGSNDECRQKNADNGWGGTVYVNYTYTVPEPSTLMLLGMGLLGLGAGRLRKRNA